MTPWVATETFPVMFRALLERSGTTAHFARDCSMGQSKSGCVEELDRSIFQRPADDKFCAFSTSGQIDLGILRNSIGRFSHSVLTKQQVLHIFGFPFFRIPIQCLFAVFSSQSNTIFLTNPVVCQVAVCAQVGANAFIVARIFHWCGKLCTALWIN